MRISVVITTFNRPDYLKLSLQSAIDQLYKAFEIIIIDDNSTADYTDVLGSFKEKDIQYVKRDVSGGANVARNFGVSIANGDIVAFLDDDDVWLNNYLEKHVEQYSTGADAVLSGFKHLNNESVVRVNADKIVTKKSLLKGNTYCGMSGFSCKRTLLLDNKFDESLPNGQDWDMYVRLFQKGIEFRNIPKPLFLYRFQTPDGIGSKLRQMRPEDVNKRLGSAFKHKEFLGDYYYNDRVAQQCLYSLKAKSNKFNWVLQSIKKAGVMATLRFFCNRVINAFHKP